MTGTPLMAFYALVGAYLVLVCGIGLWNYRRASTEEGFLAAGRSLGPVLGGATLMANQVSAGATIGIVGFHYFSGFSYAWSWPLVWIGWVVAALFIAPRIRRIAGLTLPDYLEARFESKAARALAASCKTRSSCSPPSSGALRRPKITTAAITTSPIVTFHFVFNGVLLWVKMPQILSRTL